MKSKNFIDTVQGDLFDIVCVLLETEANSWLIVNDVRIENWLKI